MSITRIGERRQATKTPQDAYSERFESVTRLQESLAGQLGLHARRQDGTPDNWQPVHDLAQVESHLAHAIGILTRSNAS